MFEGHPLLTGNLPVSRQPSPSLFVSVYGCLGLHSHSSRDAKLKHEIVFIENNEAVSESGGHLEVVS